MLDLCGGGEVVIFKIYIHDDPEYSFGWVLVNDGIPGCSMAAGSQFCSVISQLPSAVNYHRSCQLVAPFLFGCVYSTGTGTQVLSLIHI